MSARVLKKDENILMINDDGIIIRVAADDVPVLGRSTSGVRLMRTGTEGEIVDVAVIDAEDDDEDAELEELDELDELEADDVDTDDTDADDETNDEEEDET